MLGRLLKSLTPNGYLFLGQAETMNGMSDRARMAGPGAYLNVGSDPTLRFR